MNRVNCIQRLMGWCFFVVLLCSFSYRIVPVVTLAGQTNGRIDAQKFSQYKALHINTSRGENCSLEMFTLYHISLTKEMEEFQGHQCEFSNSIVESIQRAEKGDKYVFFNIKVKCAGDKTPVTVNALNFNIK